MPSSDKSMPWQLERVKKERPFALPVGMMCYTLASKILLQNKPDSRSRAKDLLEKCLEMLDEVIHLLRREEGRGKKCQDTFISAFSFLFLYFPLLTFSIE